MGNEQMPVEDTPSIYGDVNIFGLYLLNFYGLTLCNYQFSLQNLPHFFPFVPIKVSPDGKISKVILRDGSGSFPKIDQKVHLNYLKVSSFFDSQPDSQLQPLFFKLGSATSNSELQTALYGMEVGEKSIIQCLTVSDPTDSKDFSPQNSTESINFYLVELVESVSIRDTQAAMNYVELANNRAKSSFGSQNYHEAIHIYLMCLFVLDDVTLPKVYVAQRFKITRNLAVSYSKIFHWTNTLTYACKGLEIDSNDTKCLYKKAQALVYLNDSSAQDVINEAISNCDQEYLSDFELLMGKFQNQGKKE